LRRRRSLPRPSTRPSATLAPVAARGSSPVEGSLPEFIEWMKELKPEYTKDFDNARDVLIDRGYTTDIIQQWKGDDDKWGKLLPGKTGIGLQLARHVGKWGRISEQSSASHRKQSVLSLRPSPRKIRLSTTSETPGPSTATDGGAIPLIEHEQEEEDEYEYRGDMDLDDVNATQE